jgi:hypothetical protein
MPLDTLKTVLQVEGANGMALLKNKIAASGLRVVYSGALGSASATMAGHYPWCAATRPEPRTHALAAQDTEN